MPMALYPKRSEILHCAQTLDTPLGRYTHNPLTHKHVLLFRTVILCYFTLMNFFFLFPRSLSIDWMNERRRSKKKIS